MSRLLSDEELLVLLNSDTILIYIATILLKLIFSNLLHPLKLNSTRMAPFQRQCFQVYFNFAMHIFSTSKKIRPSSHERVVITQFDASRWFYVPIDPKLANSANTKCRPFQLKINCSKFIVDSLQQRCHVTFLNSLFLTSGTATHRCS